MSASEPMCTREPVSHLRLERYLLGELPEPDRHDVHAHLGECETCRTCFDALRASAVELAPLPGLAAYAPSLPIARARRGPRLALAGASLALAAAALLMLRGPGERAQLPAARTHVKGGELALSLVRERAGEAAGDPRVFAPGDRFEASLSCSPGVGPLYWELFVVQAGRVYFPLPVSSPVTCANHVTLPGAFSLDGEDPASVCVTTSERVPIARSALQANALPQASVCVTLTAAR